ncbi:MAG: hypothetical protein COB49_03725 [Alphaproteobacteria bacterium]|nr:MAG: hypothetical protein COB49_03725 [Alphaproteobacteria bacterium]
MADDDETKDDETKEEKPKSGGKKLLIIGLLVGLLLGGGGGVGAFMMLAGDGDKHEAEAEEIIVEETEPETDPYFVKIDRMTLPLVHKNRVLANVVIDFSMEVDGDDNKMTVIRNLPEIRDAMLRHFSNTAIGKTGSPRSLDYPRLKKTLRDISNKVLHDPLVLRVMIVQARQF